MGDFAACAGQTFDFYGVDCNEFKLGDVVWEAVEDPGDGYRSYLESVVVSSSVGLFHPRPLARVRVQRVKDSRLDGYWLVDYADGHVWLQFGTWDYDDCYPCFRFEYTPKSRQRLGLD